MTALTAAITATLTTPANDVVVFDRYGPAGAPAAVFISGAGLSRADDPVTTETAQLLAAKGLQASVHDRVGRGDSPTDGPVALDRELAAIEAVAAQLGGPVVLVGHSSGCALAILAASRIERLAGLVLWEAPFGLFDPDARGWWATVDESIDRGELEQAVARYMVGMPSEWLDLIRSSPAYPQLVWSWMPDGTALARVEADGLPAALRGVQAPVLAVVGTDTFPGMADAAAEIATAASNGSHEEMLGAWHSWDPEAMAARLATMLEGATAGGSSTRG
jgi:pimeloyl-ACP methyl ester carboxylesterase